jgi:hypothetical protein
MKAFILFMMILALPGIEILAGEDDSATTPDHSPQLSKPTWAGDEHDQPVFISPTNTLALTNGPATNLPPMTNSPATNTSAMTQNPRLQPPSGLAIVQ